MHFILVEHLVINLARVCYVEELATDRLRVVFGAMGDEEHAIILEGEEVRTFWQQYAQMRAQQEASNHGK